MSETTVGEFTDENGFKRLLSNKKCKEFAEDIFEFLLFDIEERVRSCNGEFDELLSYIQHQFVDVGKRASSYLDSYKADLGDYIQTTKLVRNHCIPYERKQFQFACNYITKYIKEIEDDVDFSLFEEPKSWYLHFEAIGDFYNYLSNKRQRKMFVLWCLKNVEKDSLFQQEILELLENDKMSLPLETHNIPLETQHTKNLPPKIQWTRSKNKLHFFLQACHDADLFAGKTPQWSEWEKFLLGDDKKPIKGLRQAPKESDLKERYKFALHEIINELNHLE